MRLLLLLIIQCLVVIVSAQKTSPQSDCVFKQTMQPERLLSAYPFQGAAGVRLVSYEKLENTGTEKYKIFRIASLIKEFHTVRNGEFHLDSLRIDTVNWRRSYWLNTTDQLNFAKLLFYITPAKKKITEVPCFEPKHAILFYDANGKIISILELSFACKAIKLHPSGWMNEQFCSGKWKELEKLFRQFGFSEWFEAEQ